MSSLEEFAESEEDPLLTMREATKILRIGRTLGYELAHEYLNSGGTSGLPVIRFSKECYRVPRWALIELVTTGRVRWSSPAGRPVATRRRSMGESWLANI